MADFVRIKFVNLPDFSRQLKALGVDLQTKIIRSGVRAALTVFRRAVLAAVPVHKGRYPNTKYQQVPGTLKRSIYIARSKRSSTPGVEYGIVRPRSGQKSQASLTNAYYWRWVEEGHLIRRAGQKLRGGVRRRALERSRLNSSGAARTRAFFFMKTSFDRNVEKATDAFSKRVNSGIEKANRAR